MKERLDFVTNSSSASYIIRKDKITYKQAKQIYDHSQFVANKYDAWSISESNTDIKVSTIMDNFDMHDYLVNIVGIDDQDIECGNY
jgi:hypothetical protein